MGVLPQLPIMLGGNTFLFNLLVVSGPLDFNLLLGSDYVYTINVMVYTLVRVMHFPHNGSIVTIDHLSFYNHHLGSSLPQVSPLSIPSVREESSPP
jgi:hypothetical protein